MRQVFEIWWCSWKYDKKLMAWLIGLPIVFVFAMSSLQDWSLHILSMVQPQKAPVTLWSGSLLFQVGSTLHGMLGLLFLQKYQEESQVRWWSFWVGQGMNTVSVLWARFFWAVFVALYSSVLVVVTGMWFGVEFTDIGSSMLQYMVHGVMWLSFANFISFFARQHRMTLMYLFWPLVLESFAAWLLSVLLKVDVSSYRMFAAIHEFGAFQGSVISHRAIFLCFIYSVVMWAYCFYTLKYRDAGEAES